MEKELGKEASQKHRRDIKDFCVADMALLSTSKVPFLEHVLHLHHTVW